MGVQLIWFTMTFSSVLYACVHSQPEQVLPAMLSGCGQAITLTLELGAGYILFCGLMEIARRAGVHSVLERLLRPVITRLMPNVKNEETRGAVVLNLSMNMLGMGNAATPAGIEAVRQMDAEAQAHPEVRHDLWMLLILNATSIQLLPTTILAMRAAEGSADVNAVILPTLLCTAVSTVVGTELGFLCRRLERRKT